MTRNVLFIGGCQDGIRRAVEVGSSRYMKFPKLFSNQPISEKLRDLLSRDELFEVEVELYRLETIECHGFTLHLYVLDKLMMKDAFSLLVRRYPVPLGDASWV